MRRLFVWMVTGLIGMLVLSLSVLFGMLQSPEKPESIIESGKTGPSARPIPHSIELRKNCNRCHLPGGMSPFPEDHAGLPEDGCTECHKAPGL